LSVKSFYRADPRSEPTAVSTVKGFDITIEKKEGTLLFLAQNDTSGEPQTPYSANFYYEVSVRSTGENPAYPADKTPAIYRCTTALTTDETSIGIKGNVTIVPGGSHFTQFKVIEVRDHWYRQLRRTAKLSLHFNDLAGQSDEFTIPASPHIGLPKKTLFKQMKPG
jgi:hypothetical protein